MVPRRLWKAVRLWWVLSAPLFLAGFVTTWAGVAYVHTMGGMLRAISMKNGRVLWKQDVGSLEAGKVANVIVTDGDLFEDKTSVKHVFIDGRLVKLVKVDAPTDQN